MNAYSHTFSDTAARVGHDPRAIDILRRFSLQQQHCTSIFALDDLAHEAKQLLNEIDFSAKWCPPAEKKARPFGSVDGRAAPSSGMTLDARAAGVLRQSRSTSSPFATGELSVSPASPLPALKAPGIFSHKAEIIDGLGTIAAMLALCCAAGFLLALA